MNEYNKLELFGFILTVSGGVSILASNFVEVDVDLGNVGVYCTSIGLLLYFLGNKVKADKNKKGKDF